DTATTEIYTLSLHDALPISEPVTGRAVRAVPGEPRADPPQHLPAGAEHRARGPGRGTGRVMVDGAARGAATRRHPRLAHARPGNVPGAGDLDRWLAVPERSETRHARAGLAAAASRRAAGPRRLRRGGPAPAVGLSARTASGGLLHD